MIDWTFELNDKPMSAFKTGVISFPAFSGIDENKNKFMSVCMSAVGPIPPGTYYIFDRQTGGFLQPLYDSVNDKSGWFALYADDQKIDDETYCNKVKRGAFRLHPKGHAAISRGCITIDKIGDFHHISAMLRGACQAEIPGSKLKAYGKVIVR